MQASALVTCIRKGQHVQYMCVCRRFLSSKCTDAIAERTPVSFLWRLRGAGLDETEEVTNVMYSVSERGVAMPEGWVATFHNLDLPNRHL